MMGKYTIKGMNFHAFHGSLEVERELGLVFTVDVTLHFNLSKDDLGEGAASLIKGADVFERTKGLMMGTKFKSRMSLALAIGREMLAKYENATQATVAVSRRHLFIPGDLESITAEATCTRDDL